MYGSITSTFSPAPAGTSQSASDTATTHVRRMSLEIKPAATGSSAVARAQIRIGGRKHRVGGGTELVLPLGRRVADPVLEQLDVRVLVACKNQSPAVQHVLQQGLSDQKALPGRTDDRFTLCRDEVLVHVSGPDDIGRVRRIRQIDGLRGRNDTESAAGAAGVVMTACGSAGVGRRDPVQRDRQLFQEDGVHTTLEIGERQMLRSGQWRIADRAAPAGGEPDDRTAGGGEWSS